VILQKKEASCLKYSPNDEPVAKQTLSYAYYFKAIELESAMEMRDGRY